MEIRIENLTKAYGDFKAVDGMTLNIADGELIGLLGPSGCGKSTTLFMLAGLNEPTSGRIFFGDKEVTHIPPEDREIGLVFQNYALYPHMTVLDNITFPLINRKVKKAEAIERATEMAHLVQLDGLLNRKPSALSGGQQQRVAIARALVKKPQVLLLDEPLSNLDAKLRVETREEIKRIQSEVKITTIFVTHDQEEAMSISNRIAVMNKGVVQQYDAPQSMYLNPINAFVAQFLGTPQINMFNAQITERGAELDGTLLCSESRMKAEAGESLPNGTYQMGIRPESLELCDDGFTVTADSVRMTGRDLLIFFHIGDTEFRALTHSDQHIQAGDKLCLRIRKNALIIFDENGNSLVKY